MEQSVAVFFLSLTVLQFSPIKLNTGCRYWRFNFVPGLLQLYGSSGVSTIHLRIAIEHNTIHATQAPNSFPFFKML